MPHLPRTLVHTLRGHSGAVQCATFNAARTFCLTGGVDRTVALWNPYRTRASSPLARYRGPGSDVRAIASSGDGSRIAACGGDRCAFVWDVVSGASERRVFGHEGRLNALALSPGGGGVLLATASDDKTVRVVDLRAGGGGGGGGGGGAGGGARGGRSGSHTDAAVVLTGFSDAVTHVSFAPGGGGGGGGASIVASSLDGSIREWDTRSARVLSVSLPTRAPIAALALDAPSGLALAATPRAGGALILLDFAEGPGKGSILSVLSGFSAARYRLQPAFLPAGGGVVSGDECGRVVAWPLDAAGAGAPPRPPTLLAAHSEASPLAWVQAQPAPGGGGGAVMLTASHDGTAKLWANDEASAAVAALG
jgi:mitogen-activated protein kinase organizer 1